LENDLSWQQR